MKKKICIYLAFTLCVLFQPPTYAEPDYEELSRFLDDFHRMNLSDWVPEHEKMIDEFGNLSACKVGEIVYHEKFVRAYERFVSMAIRYYGDPDITKDLFNKTFEILERGGFDNKLILSTKKTIDDVDKSFVLMPIKGLLVKKFKKKIQTADLPRADIPPIALISEDYETHVEELNVFLDNFHKENLDASVSSPESARSTFNENLENIHLEFNTVFPEENGKKTNAIYTIKIDICRAYIRFIPIVMQYYCDEELIKEIFVEAFKALKEIDPYNNYPQATELVDSTELMIDTINSIGKVESGGILGKFAGGARNLLTSGFKKKTH